MLRIQCYEASPQRIPVRQRRDQALHAVVVNGWPDGVQLVDVDVVRAEPLERCIELAFQGRSVDQLAVDAQTGLAGDDHPVATARVSMRRLARWRAARRNEAAVEARKRPARDICE